jgi:transposase
MVSLIFPTSNAEIMTLFLKHVSQQFPDFFIIMQVDGAGWHRSHKVQVPENMRLLFQPPYSPELNPVEHIWDEIREKYFHNCVFSSLGALEERICTALNELSSQTDCVRSITYFPHIKVACENAS